MKTLTICPNCKKLNRVEIETDKKPTCGNCQTPLPIHGPYSELSANELKTLIEKSSKPVVVDFWAPWCGPCRAFAPEFEKVARNEAENYVFVKVNTQEYPLAGDFYGIRGIPTLVLFKNGLEAKRISGAMPAPQFLEWIKSP